MVLGGNVAPRTEQDVVKLLVSRQVFLLGMATAYGLSQFGTQSLGTPLGSFIVDPPAVKLGREFQEELRDIERIIAEENAARDPQYGYLYPSRVPNSIGI
nr:hypothetical protein BaRGS_019662 [Batillaria attramentaria]